MSDADRREFLRKLAKSAIYTAPVIHTFAAPRELIGQGQGSQHMMSGGGGHGMSGNLTAPAPWDQPPPASMNP